MRSAFLLAAMVRDLATLMWPLPHYGGGEQSNLRPPPPPWQGRRYKPMQNFRTPQGIQGGWMMCGRGDPSLPNNAILHNKCARGTRSSNEVTKGTAPPDATVRAPTREPTARVDVATLLVVTKYKQHVRTTTSRRRCKRLGDTTTHTKARLRSRPCVCVTSHFAQTIHKRQM